MGLFPPCSVPAAALALLALLAVPVSSDPSPTVPPYVGGYYVDPISGSGGSPPTDVSRPVNIAKRGLDTFLTAISDINDQVNKLGDAVNEYDGGSGQPIKSASEELVSVIEDSVEEMEGQKLSDTEVFQLVFPVRDLTDDIYNGIDTIISKKDDFVDNGLGGMMLTRLTKQKNAAETLSDVISSTVSENLQDIAEELSNNMINAIQRGIDVYTGVPTGAGNSASSSAPTATSSDGPTSTTTVPPTSSSSSSSTPLPAASSSSSSGSKAWIAGAVIGPLAGIALIGVGIWYWRRKARRSNSSLEQQQDQQKEHPKDQLKDHHEIDDGFKPAELDHPARLGAPAQELSATVGPLELDDSSGLALKAKSGLR